MANGDPLILGTDNTASFRTRLVKRGGSGRGPALEIASEDGTHALVADARGGGSGILASGTVGLWASSETGTGAIVDGKVTGLSVSGSEGAGVHAISTRGNGVYARSMQASAIRAEGHSDEPAVWCQNFADGPGLEGVSDKDYGVRGSSLDGVGVLGTSAQGEAGVVGSGSGGTAVGVRGSSEKMPGVQGDTTSGEAAVLGRSAGKGAGVRAESAEGPGVHATGRSMGVFGASPGVGVRGDSADVGVAGTAVRSSQNGAGVAGLGNHIGVVGITNAPGGFGVVGVASPAGIAGFFNGDLVVNGAKSSAVPFRDGSRRLLYAMESPECWFEDFGSAKLGHGRVRVALRADFAATVRTDAYHVFLTPEGDANALYVTAKTRTGFEVRESGGGRSAIAFSYRIVARRKDVDAPRLRKVKPPRLPDARALRAEPRLPEAPKRRPKKRRAKKGRATVSR